MQKIVSGFAYCRSVTGVDCTRFNQIHAGMVTIQTAVNHAAILPKANPIVGIVHAANHAYALTLVPPNINGPTAPAPMDSPWASHKPHIAVRKMAGKTDAIPATSGPLCSANQTDTPMAKAAITPRLAIAIIPGWEPALGAGGFFLHAMIPTIPMINVTAMAQ